MRNWKRKTIALLLALCMTLSMLPVSALAALTDNTPDQNQQILTELKELWGDDATAEQAMALLREYGLVDEEGNVLTDWEVTLDGEAVTLAELSALVQDEANLDRVVRVDGKEMPLRDFKVMLEIEAELRRIQETYFADRTGELTEEHITALQSLREQVANGGLRLLGAGGGLDFPSGVGHDAQVTMRMDYPSVDAGPDSVGIAFDLANAMEGQEVTFQVRALAGSATPQVIGLISDLIDDGSATITQENDVYTVTLTAKEDGTAMIRCTLTVSTPDALDWNSGLDLYDGAQVFFVQAHNIENALFDGGVTSVTEPVAVNYSNSDYKLNLTEEEFAETFSFSADFKAVASVTGDPDLLQRTTWYGTHFGSPSIRMYFLSNDFLTHVGLSTENVKMDEASPLFEHFLNETDPATSPVGEFAIARTTLGAYGFSVMDSLFLVGHLRQGYDLYTDDPELVPSGAWTVFERNLGSSNYMKHLKENNEFLAGFFDSGGWNSHDYSHQYTGDFMKYWGSIKESFFNPDGTSFPKLKDGEQFIEITEDIKYHLSDINYLNVNLYAYKQTLWARASDSGYVKWEINDPEVFNNLQFTAVMRVVDQAQPQVTGVTAPAGKYTTGDQIPITVQFNEPVRAQTGQELTLLVTTTDLDTPVSVTVPISETGATSRVTALFTVPELMNSFLEVKGVTGTVEDLSGNKMEDYTHPSGSDNYVLAENSITTPTMAAAIPTGAVSITTPTVSYDAETGETVATATVTVALPTETQLRELVLGKDFTLVVDNIFASNGLALSADGGETFYDLTVTNTDNPTAMTAEISVPITPELAQSGGQLVLELYETERDTQGQIIPNSVSLFFGRYAAMIVPACTPLTADDMTITLPEGFPTEPFFLDNPPTEEKLKLGYSIASGNYTWDDVEWLSSDPAVATISNDENDRGQISLLGPGTVTFSLAAQNGGVYQTNGAYPAEHVQTLSGGNAITLTVAQGNTPYLRVSRASVMLTAGSPLAFNWLSNLPVKHAELEKDTTYTLTITPQGSVEPLKLAYDATTNTVTVDETGTTSVALTYLAADAKDENGEWKTGWPRQQVTIQGLGPATGENRTTYVVKIEAAGAEGLTGFAGAPFSAQSTVTVTTQPAKVTLVSPESQFLTDRSETFTGSYQLANFTGGDASEFALTVIDNATGEEVPATADNPENGLVNFSFPISGKVGGSGFRNIYDVTVAARNLTDNEWCRSSYTLYVYDRESLDILVKPVDNRVTVGTNTVTMSNEEWISGLSQDAILDLQRDINLQTVISINYGDKAWSEVADRIQWKSDNSDVAAVNYNQAAYYENIENLPYGSYAPKTEFILSGKGDGEGITVTASHAQMVGDLFTSVDVTVNTLKDKLYLFQFYPAIEATLEYENGSGVVVKRTTNASGQAAIYEPNGIKGDVYVKAVAGDGTVYLGTVYHGDLKSGEPDAVTLEPYPLNTLNLREAASVPVYLKKPDGTPFTGTVNARVGVYRNGELCEEARVDDQLVNVGKTEDYTLSFTGGSHTFRFNLDQFVTTSQPNIRTDPVDATDRLKFVVELRAEGHYPVLVTFNGSVNADDVVRMGQRVVNLEAVPEGQGNKPFVAQQIAYFSQAESLSVNVRDTTGKLGPSPTYPTLSLETNVYWWGVPTGDLRLTDETGVALAGQTWTDNVYPFCSVSVTQGKVLLDEAQLEHLNIGDYKTRGLRLEYADASGTLIKQQDMPYTLVNTLRMKGPTEASDGLKGQLNDLISLVKGSTTKDGLGGLDGFLSIGLQMATKVGPDLGFLKLQLAPTANPTVFKGLVYVGANNMTDDNVTSVNADSSQVSDLDMMPDWDTIKGVAKNGLANYGKTAENMVTGAANILKGNVTQMMGGKSTVGDGSTFYALNGYFETEVYYDYDLNQWKMVVLTGGFQVGGGYGYDWTTNLQVGPVPMFIQLGLGAAVDIEFKAAIDRTQNANDYLTQLRVNAYIRAFAGLGFDYSVIAAKIGLYGQLDFTATMRWLNAIGQQQAMFGYELDLNGEVGVKVELRILFVSYERILWSKKFNIATLYDTEYKANSTWNKIDEYWETVQKGNSGYDNWGGIIGPTTRMRNSALLFSTGDTGVYATDSVALVESRDYLDDGQFWTGGGPGISLMEMDNEGKPVIKDGVWYNAYPNADPSVSEDGGLAALLIDQSSQDVTLTRAATTVRSGGVYYTEPAIIDDDNSDTNNGYGDSQLKLAGEAGSAAVVWSRMTTPPPAMEPGAVITASDQAAMLDATDVFCAIQKEDGWTLTNLSAGNSDQTNGLPDMAPVVATNGTTTLVAWRQVVSSDSTELTTFDAGDYILYRVTKDGGKTWTKPQTLYNGVNSEETVMGLEAAMLADGTACVTYSTSAQDSYVQKCHYAIIKENPEASQGTDGNADPYVISRFATLSDGKSADQNPQLATAKIWDEDTGAAVEHFILGWYSAQVDENDPVNGSGDIRLAAVNGAGNRKVNFVDNLSALTRNSGVSVSDDFRFSRGANTIDQLSVLWSEPVVEAAVIDKETMLPQEGIESSTANHYVLNALRFRTDDNGALLGVTAAQTVGEMNENTTINAFDAYVDTESNLKALILGTSYNMMDYNTVTTNYDGGNEPVTVYLPKETASLYAATLKYTDTLRVDSVLPDYLNIRLGASLPIQFGVTNLGTQPLDAVTVKVGDDSTTFEGSSFVPIQPGESRTLTVYYAVPTTGIVNPDYVVTGTNSLTTEYPETPQILTLNIPDLGIASAETVRSQENGKRVLQYTLYNSGDAKLAGSGRSVEFNLFSDPECTLPVPAQYFTDITAQTTETAPLKTISGDALADVDTGSYTFQLQFDLAEYIQQTEGAGEAQKTPFADEDGEIRDGGVTLYAKVWVELPDSDDGEMVEVVTSNNITSVTFESLLKQAGAPVTIQSELTTNDSGGTDVTVTLKNNSIVESKNGNIIVTLYDAQGNILEAQQSYQPQSIFSRNVGGNGLLTLAPEARDQKNFSFSQKGASVGVTFSNLILDGGAAEADASISTLSFQGVPVTLNEFVPVEGETTDGKKVYTASVSTTDLTQVLVSATAKSAAASVTVNGESLELRGATVALTEGENTIEVVITSQDKTASSTYRLTLTNTRTGGSSSSFSERAISKIKNANGGDTVKVELPSNGKLPGKVLEEAAGRDITLEISAGSGVTWIINGKDIPTGKLSDLNLKVDTKASTIPVTVINALTGETKVMQLALSHNGDFPVPLTLRLDAGKENAGLFANLYYYNETEKALEYQTTAEIGLDGNAYIPFAHASSYAVVIDAVSHAPANPFTDVAEDAYYADAVAWAVAAGVTNGTGPATFSPDLTCTRAQTVTFLWRSAGSPAPKTTQMPFSDVAEDAYYRDAVLWAVENGITQGTGGSAFSPDAVVTRAQTVTFLWRAAGSPASEAAETSFADVPENAYYRDAVLWAVENGITQGTGGSAFSPGLACTRAQTVTFLWRSAGSPAPQPAEETVS